MPYSPLTPHPSPLLVLVGPTASGKSELAVKLAKRFNGEIISVDSRQIYRGMDIGTGKVAGRWVKQKINETNKSNRSYNKSYPSYSYKDVPHHCIDYVNPKRQYSAALFKRDAQKAIRDILGRGKLPILCGGTGHWVDAVVYDQELPDVKPNKKLRAQLEKKSADALFKKLMKLDPVRAKNIDRFNKRRLIRALEIVISTGSAVPALNPAPSPLYATLWLGIQTNQTDLYKKIKKRLKERLKQGMVKEVELLHSPSLLARRDAPKGQRARSIGLSWHRLESFGLEYRFVSLYLQKKITYDEMFTQLLRAIKHYSKRQLTWWKKNKEIKWIKNYSQANSFLSSRLTK